MKLWYIATLFMCCCATYCQEYLYPVAVLPAQQAGQPPLAYVIYQKSLQHLELWQWDPATLVAHKALLSSFMPAGLQILPDYSGFSFIDNGRIKVKSFAKRAPKAIDIYQPIYNINIINWIDEVSCYFSAQEDEVFNIYHLFTNTQQLHRLVHIPGVDCIYPCALDNTLFFIGRMATHNPCRYTLCCVPYPAVQAPATDFNTAENFDERVSAYIQEQKKFEQGRSLTAPAHIQTIYDFGSRPMAFLTMTSPTQGYVVEHASSIEKQDKMTALIYYQLNKKADGWHPTLLFSFNIPLNILMHDAQTRLYESILPLLPKIIDNHIYFSSCVAEDNLNLNLFSYDLVAKQVKQLTNTLDGVQHYFSPIKINNALILGGSLGASKPVMNINEDQEITFEFPQIT